MLLSRIALCFFLLPLCASLSLGQSKASPDRWRGLILDQSTSEDAIKILGQPVEDKFDRIRIQKIDKWIGAAQKEKSFRKLIFKSVDGFDKAELAFSNGKLVLITLDFKKEISPNALANIYGIEFRPMVSGIDVAFSPRDYERHKGTTYPKTYPDFYYMVATSEPSFISAWVENTGFKSMMKQLSHATEEGNFPGKVKVIQLISRTLENRDGADVLSGDNPLSGNAPNAQADAKPQPSPTPKRICAENGRRIK
jgi:hypothetical protein